MNERAEVKRPGLLATAAGVTLAAVLVLGGGLYELGARRAAAPAVIAVEKAVLAEALADAPWISSGGGRAVVWVVTAPNCPRCRTLEQDVLPGLIEQGVEARVILVSPRRSAAREAKVVAALARRRDWTALDAWMRGRGDRTGVALEPAAAEGYLEWGRASYDRIARTMRRNGLVMAAPAVFWRDGPEWRATIAPDHRALGHVKRQIPTLVD